MKTILYILKKMGVKKSLLYLILYPLRFFRKGLAKLDDIHDEIRWHRKIASALKKTDLRSHKLSSQDINHEAREYFGNYGFVVNTDWLIFYENLNGIKSKYYIPEDLYYRIIEPQFIDKQYLRFYEDKNMYNILFEGFRQPETFLRYFDGTFYSADYTQIRASEAAIKLKEISSSWLIKPTVESGNGRDIKAGSTQNGIISVNGDELTLKELVKTYCHGFIIQEKITSQNKTLAQFHPESLNTIRVITLRLNNKIHVISKRVKFGVSGHIVDNDKGIWCGVDSNGLIRTNGINAHFEKFDAHPDTGKKFKGTKIIDFNNILEFSIRLHKKVYRIDMISWDIGYSDKNEPIFIECNTKFQGITTSQVVNGPLFGDLTDDVLAEVVRRRNGNPA